MKDDRTVSTVPAAPITPPSPMSLSGHSRGYCDVRLLADDEGVPLICPTCQVLAQSVLGGARLLLCMGLFSIFLLGANENSRAPPMRTRRTCQAGRRRAACAVGRAPSPPPSRRSRSRPCHRDPNRAKQR